ncbi:MAG TPA: OmpA family protein [Desulfuromonadaceae bacterium]
MKTTNLFGILFALTSLGTLFGCAHNYEVNTGRGGVPGHYIRYEMQDADRALESARLAGKDRICPAEYKDAEDAKNHAYDVYRACHTEEGVALAKQATAKANALCPPQESRGGETKLEERPAAAPTPGHYKYCITLQIEYDIDKADIRPEYDNEVAKVGDFMNKYPTTTAVIEGYSDNVGTREHNLDLSRRRAENVVKYLTEKFGIDPTRLSAKGYGPERPAADNTTNEGKQSNRRISAIIDCAFDVKEIQPPPEQLCMTLQMEFDFGKADIKPEYTNEITKVGEYMKKYPTTTAVIEGHTDNVGSREYNMKLSLERAQNVVNYLVDNFGIDRSRLSAKGYGESRRIAYNNTPEGRKMNRRIDAVIDCVVKK